MCAQTNAEWLKALFGERAAPATYRDELKSDRVRCVAVDRVNGVSRMRVQGRLQEMNGTRCKFGRRECDSSFT